MGFIENVAKACHDVNRAYCKSIGDDSQPMWEDLTDETKLSAICGVRAVINNPGGTPEESHACWSKFKTDNGWVYGKEKDESKKTHHCLVEYSELPIEQRTKDYLFMAVVETMTE